MYPTIPLPHPVFKNISLKAIREFRPLITNYLDSLLDTCNKLCTFLHHNLVSVVWLYCVWASGPKFGSVIWWVPYSILQPQSKSTNYNTSQVSLLTFRLLSFPSNVALHFYFPLDFSLLCFSWAFSFSDSPSSYAKQSCSPSALPNVHHHPHHICSSCYQDPPSLAGSQITCDKAYFIVGLPWWCSG